MSQQGTTLQAVERSFAVLEVLNELDGAGVTELAHELDLPKSTAHNHLSTLYDLGYVVRKDEQYHVATCMLALGEHARNQREVFTYGRPEINKLAEETGELGNLLVEEHGRGVYLYRARGGNAVRVDTFSGKRTALHCTALGKSILANLPESRVEEIVRTHGLPARTDKTITDRDDLWGELEAIRERGYAFDDEERLPGMRCVAAPVVLSDGTVKGAISVTGPISRMKDEWYRSELPEMVVSATNIVEVNIEYS
jgi:DNA-binding IclR family transcriptional regulator